MKVGQMIYWIDMFGVKTPYIIYGIDNEMVFAIMVHSMGTHHCNFDFERIKINIANIQNFCFCISNTYHKIGNDDEKIMRNNFKKNEKHIKNYFKKNGMLFNNY